MDKIWIDEWLQKKGAVYSALSRRIWEFAETGMEEQRSAAALCEKLEEEGFKVERNLAGIATAFSGTFGSGKPQIAFLGEFDALEGLSQKASCARKEPAEPDNGGINKNHDNGNGHGCGHNLLGVGSLASAVAVKEYMQENGLSGTVLYFGCPGEEKGCGKVHMAKAGCFSELDAALTWHPMDYNGVEGMGSLADLCLSFSFTGTSAHAAACPHMGRSALDAVELLNVACNFMREHMVQEARIHYAITDAGGSSPNVIPDFASVDYEVRAPKLEQALELRGRLCRAAKGAAMMTDTEVEICYGDSYGEYIPNDCLNRVAWEKLKEAGPGRFTREEHEFAAALSQTYREKETSPSCALDETLTPYTGLGGCLAASTDVGDVSQLVPTMQLYTASCAIGTPSHSWQMTSQTGSSVGVRGMFSAACVMALTAAELIENTEILENAWEEYKRSLKK